MEELVEVGWGEGVRRGGEALDDEGDERGCDERVGWFVGKDNLETVFDLVVEDIVVGFRGKKFWKKLLFIWGDEEVEGSFVVF